ncbi:MAG: heavy metal-binding domain-containing protein [Chitinophagales bacterium]
MNFRFLISFLAIGLVAFTLTACGGETAQSHDDGHDHATEEKAVENHDGHDHDSHEGHDHEAGVDMTSVEYGSTYVCPMHCEGSGSDVAGSCPVCGMEYVLNAEHQEDAHKH